MKARVRQPTVKQRKDRPSWPWIFRYWAEETGPDGNVGAVRKYYEIGPSKGDGALTKEPGRNRARQVLAERNAPTAEEAKQQVAATGVALFGKLERMYEEGYLCREKQIATPTRAKEAFYLHE